MRGLVPFRILALCVLPVNPLDCHTRAEGAPHAAIRGSNYVIEFAPYAVEVDPADGGRIVAFSIDGRSVLLSREESPVAYGSSFWPSPQKDWAWPPPQALDRDPWNATVVDGSALALESGVDAKLGLSATQRIVADRPRGAVTIEYVLTNRAGSARRVAPWQNSRVRPNGLTFFASSGPALPASSLKLDPINGVAWLAHSKAAFPASAKLFAEGAEGWIAHVDGDLVFVKAFPHVPGDAQAPGEAEIEIYVHESGRFVEMEQQGPYVELSPGASSSWSVHWLVRRLPPGIEAQPRSQSLVDYVRNLVAGVR
jgi:Domain of unknown function (DUF4380)